MNGMKWAELVTKFNIDNRLLLKEERKCQEIESVQDSSTRRSKRSIHEISEFSSNGNDTECLL